jgi:hypothetical protein
MKKLGLLLLLSVVLVFSIAAAKEKIPTSITLTNEPAYGEYAEFDVHLSKHYQYPLGAIWCWQNGEAVMARHMHLVDKYGSSWTGSARTLMVWNGNDPTAPASCTVVVFDEKRSNRQDEVALSDWINFRIEAQE